MTLAPFPDAAADDDALLDSYSRSVTSVAELLLPSVASLQIRGRGGRTAGAGSAVVVTPDGFLVTSAHVVASGQGGQAALIDGRQFEFEVVGRDALSDLAVIRGRARDLPGPRWATPTNFGSANWWWPSGTHWGSQAR